MRCHHYDQFGIAAVDRLRGEKSAKNWDVADSRDLAHLRLRTVIDEAGDSEGLSILEFDFRFRPAR